MVRCRLRSKKVRGYPSNRCFRCLSGWRVEAHMRFELYAWVFVGEGSLVQASAALGLFAYHAVADSLTSRNYKGRWNEWNVKSVRRVRILGNLHVPSHRPRQGRHREGNW